jgi:hypothetical protein
VLYTSPGIASALEPPLCRLPGLTNGPGTSAEGPPSRPGAQGEILLALPQDISIADVFVIQPLFINSLSITAASAGAAAARWDHQKQTAHAGEEPNGYAFVPFSVESYGANHDSGLVLGGETWVGDPSDTRQLHYHQPPAQPMGTSLLSTPASTTHALAGPTVSAHCLWPRLVRRAVPQPSIPTNIVEPCRASTPRYDQNVTYVQYTTRRLLLWLEYDMIIPFALYTTYTVASGGAYIMVLQVCLTGRSFMQRSVCVRVASLDAPSRASPPQYLRDVGRMPAAERAALAEKFGYRSIGEELPDNVKLSEIVKSLPKDVFKIDNARSWLAALTSLIAFPASLALVHFSPTWFLPIAWFIAGTAFTGWFVIGHDAGHRSFHTNKLVEDIVGNFFFAPLLYPFEPWRIKHNQHHAFTNKLDDDTAWHPVMKEEVAEMDKSGTVGAFAMNKLL